jgi:hypothetical protein
VAAENKSSAFEQPSLRGEGGLGGRGGVFFGSGKRGGACTVLNGGLARFGGNHVIKLTRFAC